MAESNGFILIIFLFSFLLALIFIFVVVRLIQRNSINYNSVVSKIDLPKKKEEFSSSAPPKQRSCGARENFSFDGDFFYIHNHLNKGISIKSSNIENGSQTLFKIAPKSKKGIDKATAYTIFLNENDKQNYLSVYTLEHGITPLHPDTETFFGEFKFKTREDTIIKELHIGMVTSKFIETHAQEDVTPGANAVQGRSRVYIHNLTPKILRLNYNIVIPPNDTLIYYGFDYFGVRLGTVFKDQDGFFDDFIYTIPATDIIYGVTSDFDNPKFGGYVLDLKNMTDMPHEPQFLLEEGWMGGPAFSNIDPSFLPYDGIRILPIDRWGRFIKGERKIKNWIHSDDRKPFKIQGNLHIV